MVIEQTERQVRMTAARIGPKIDGWAPYCVYLAYPDGKVYTYIPPGVYPGHGAAIDETFRIYNREGINSFVEEKPPVTKPTGQWASGSTITAERSNYTRGWFELWVDKLFRRGDPYDYTIHTKQGPIYGNVRASNEWDARIRTRLIEGQI